MFDRKPLGEAVAWHSGGGTPSRQVPSYWNGSIPWASVKDFTEDAESLSSTQECISQKGLSASASNLIPAGTPLVCTRMAVGRSAMTTVPTAINQDVKALFPAPGFTPQYLLALLQHTQRLAEAQSVGSTVKGVRILDYLTIQVPLAPSVEQPKIAEILNTLTKAIHLTEAIVEKLKQLKQGLLHDLLTRGVDANGELRPCYEQAPDLYRRSRLGWIPRDWEVLELGDAAQSLVDGPFGSNLKTEHYVETPGVPVVRLQNILACEYDDSERAYISDSHAASLSRNRVEGGDVLIASLGDANYPVGRACCYPMDQANAINKADCFRLRGGKRCRNAFIMLFLNGVAARRQVRGYEQGVTMKRINLGNLRRVLVSLPGLVEQDMIAERFAAAHQRMTTAVRECEKLRKQKSALMDDLLTGRKRVISLLEAATP